ncbi:MAG: hypothetical protein PHX30_01695 [Candidatus Pacebacteria bacterium]|nr:hypothetical protein [Candidatus Paceibacterota bacterium]
MPKRTFPGGEDVSCVQRTCSSDKGRISPEHGSVTFNEVPDAFIAMRERRTLLLKLALKTDKKV